MRGWRSGAPRPCRSAALASARSSGSMPRRSSVWSSSVSSLSSAGRAPLGQRARQVLQHGAQPARDLEVRRAVQPDLAAGQLDEVFPVGRAEDHARPAVGVVDHVVVQLAPADRAQQAMQLVDRQHCRGRIVDRLAERLDGDVDDDRGRRRSHPARWCARGPNATAAAQALGRRAERRRRRAGTAARRCDEVADLVDELDDAVGPLGLAPQRLEIDREDNRRTSRVQDRRGSAARGGGVRQPTARACLRSAPDRPARSPRARSSPSRQHDADRPQQARGIVDQVEERHDRGAGEQQRRRSAAGTALRPACAPARRHRSQGQHEQRDDQRGWCCRAAAWSR